MTKLVNRAKMTTATTGTGTITLGSAVDGFQTFADAGVVNTNIVRYVIEDGSNWEIGLGTYSSTGPTLTRGSIESNNADAAISLSGNAVVFLTAAAADLQELIDFADNFALPTADGTNGQVLTTNGSGTLSFTTISGYTNSDVDAHLNTSTASSGEVLSWTGSDYDWIAVSGGATDINGLSDGYSVGNSVGLGSGALANDDGSTNLNTAVGVNSSATLTTGAFNTSVGYVSYQNGNGFGNTAIGYQALNAATSGDSNTALGQNALFSVTTSSDSVAVGKNAGVYVTGAENTAIGSEALSASNGVKLTGTRNVGIGREVGFDLSTGSNNFLGGYRAGYDLTTGSNNVAIGNGALDAATTGGTNVAIGQNAMGAGVATATNGQNIAIGTTAGNNITSGGSNVAIGDRAGSAITDGGSNVLLGPTAGQNLNASRCVAIGTGSLANTTGSDNIGIGTQAGQTLTTGGSNFFGGYQAGRFVTTGSNNVAIGNFALDAATTGGQNIAIGTDAMGLGVATSANAYNVAIGYQSGYDITSATNNVLVGYRSGYNLTTGGENVHVGRSAGNSTTSGTNQIVIGSTADASSATVSNEITLGNSSITTLRCQVTTITSLSDARDKTDIQPLNAGLDFVEALNPVSFTWNMRDGGKVGEADTGFIAQDLQMAQEWAGVTIPGLVYDVNPDKLEAGYGKLIPVLVQAIKDLSAKVNYLEAQLEAKP